MSDVIITVVMFVLAAVGLFAAVMCVISDHGEKQDVNAKDGTEPVQTIPAQKEPK